MKALRLFFLLCLVLIALGYAWWVQMAPGIPVSRTIVNSEGQSLDVVVVGRTDQTLHFDRLSDGVRYELPFGKLSWKDRILFAERLPEQDPPPVAVKEEPADPYITSRRRQIEELQQKKKEFLVEIKSGSLNNLLASKRKEDLLSIEKEILELEGAINIYKSRSGQ